jgi:ribose/xylose/arabinose/galactoside ABC-type transport system permease subunit
VESGASGPTLLAVIIIGGTIYTFGYARAVMHRANSDYKKTKAALPGMRKTFWATWWAAVKVGFWVLIALALLIAWVMHEARR